MVLLPTFRKEAELRELEEAINEERQAAETIIASMVTPSCTHLTCHGITVTTDTVHMQPC